MSHINKKGNPYIIDVSNKDVTERVAVASGEIKFDKETYKKIKSFETKKGNLEKTAIIGGIMGAKETSRLIPLCHNIPINHINIEVIKNHKKFILKAPTGAGKTVLASEIIKKFYVHKKILVLCHRIVLLEQLERELKINHKVRKLGISDDIKCFGNADIVLSTNLRSKYAIASLIPERCKYLSNDIQNKNNIIIVNI